MFKTPALILTSLLLTALGLGHAAQPAGTEAPTKDGRILIRKQGNYLVVTPDGKQISETPSDQKKGTYVLLAPDGKTVDFPFPEKTALLDPSTSPDGKRVAFIASGMPPYDMDFNFHRSVLVHDTSGKGEGTKLELTAQNLAWTPDGKLLVVEAASMKDVRQRKFTTWLVDAGTKEKTKVDLPEGAQVFAVTSDGKSFIATTYDADAKKQHLTSISRDGKNVTRLVEFQRAGAVLGMSTWPRLSPDGTRVLFVDADMAEKLPAGGQRFPRLYVHDLTAKKTERIADIPLDAFVWEFAWSPDSKRVAYVWKRMEPGVPLAFSIDAKGKIDEKLMTETETHLNVTDPNGKNNKTILSAKGKSAPEVTLMNMIWR